jgi:toxin ParE1/3/4
VHGGRHFGSVLYRLAALADLDRIHDTTREMWGLAHAGHYLSQLRTAIDRVVRHPHSGRVYDVAATEYRAVRSGRHLIFYRLEPDAIVVVRMLSGES